MRASTAALLSVALSLAAAAARAHVTANPDSAAADAYVLTQFTVPHGCDGSSTVAVRIKIPEGVASVKPQMKPGWKVEIKMRKLATPLKAENGAMLTETVDEVDWRGGPLPDNMYDSFGFVMKMPAGADRTLYFPTVQECEQGSHRWVNIPAAGQKWNEVREPAPFIRLIDRH